MPFDYCDKDGKCCWCHEGEPEYPAWDWMICEKCFRELEEEDSKLQEEEENKMAKKPENMNRDELRKLASKLNIQGRGKMLKAELLAAILKLSGKKVPAKKISAKKKQELTNHIALILDVSGSMSSLSRRALTTANKTISTLKEQAKQTGQETTLTLVTFSNFVKTHYVQKPIDEVQPLTDYRCHVTTALMDAVGQTANEMRFHYDADAEDVSYLLLTITDGYENASKKFTPAKLNQLIQDNQSTDRWTFTFLVPPGHKRTTMNHLGVPEGNVREWEQTDAGLKKASETVVASMSSYYTTRSRGERSTKAFFTDMSGVTKSQVKKQLTDLSPKVQEATVESDTVVADFCKKRFGAFKKGAGYYELTKPERVQSYKGILIMGKEGSFIYGGQEARQLLGLPDSDIRVRPGDHGKWKIFVQSTSVNRKLIAGTKFLYAPSL